MTRRSFISFFLGLFCVALAPLGADTTEKKPATTLQHHGMQWHLRLDEAQLEAQKSKKPILLFFTGSDWCSWCMKFDGEILADADFIPLLGDKFVFVQVDSPRYTKLPEDLDEHYDDLHDEYDIEGYPTVVIVNEKGTKLAELGYVEGGAKAFAKELEEALPQGTLSAQNK